MSPSGFPGVTTLEDVYLHDPVPACLPVSRPPPRARSAVPVVDGVRDRRRARREYRYFPRLCAFAEIAWSIESPERPTSYEEFEGRLAHHLGRLAAMGVNFRPLDGTCHQ